MRPSTINIFYATQQRRREDCQLLSCSMEGATSLNKEKWG
jgi:hypothetical protein